MCFSSTSTPKTFFENFIISLRSTIPFSQSEIHKWHQYVFSNRADSIETNVACKIIKKAFLMGGSRPLFLYFRLVNLQLTVKKFPISILPMTGFEPQTFGVGSNRSTNWPQALPIIKYLHLCSFNICGYKAQLFATFSCIIFCLRHTYQSKCSIHSIVCVVVVHCTTLMCHLGRNLK